jgi:hypothetical protein
MEKELKSHLNNIINSTVTFCGTIKDCGTILMIELDKNNIQYYFWLNCIWRIENDSKVIATSADDITTETGLIAKSVKMLEGKQVLSFELSKFNDLFIEFSDNIYIRVLNIFSYSNIDDYNWNFWIPSEDLSFEITNNFDVKRDKYYSND